MPARWRRQTAADAYNTIVTIRNGNVKYTEEITAGYVQGSLRLGKLRVLGGVRVEQIEEPMMREIRTLDKLIDELAKGKAMEKILRK